MIADFVVSGRVLFIPIQHAITVGCIPKLNDETLVPKTMLVLFIRHQEISLILNFRPLLCWLPLVMLEGTEKTAGASILLRCGPWMLNYQNDKQDETAAIVTR